MARQKTYETSDVVEKAMHAFWEHGYEATSMKTLVDRMGLNPGSIYAAFGDKRNLFQLALAQYEENGQELLHELEAQNSPRDAILGLFEFMIEDAKSAPGNCGCFVVNSILESHPNDPDITRTLQKSLDLMRDFLQRMIINGQKSGEIKSDLDPEKTALLLQTLVCGTRILSRGQQNTTAIQNALDHAKKIL